MKESEDRGVFFKTVLLGKLCRKCRNFCWKLQKLSINFYYNLTWICKSARIERISLVTRWATADCNVIVDFTFSVNSALSDAWIDAVSILVACLISSAFDRVRAFTSAAVRQRISTMSGRTRTHWSAA
jgi:hypothetical protein